MVGPWEVEGTGQESRVKEKFATRELQRNQRAEELPGDKYPLICCGYGRNVSTDVVKASLG